MKTALLDTSLDSNNDGDKIIVSAVLRAIPELSSAPRIPTHRLPTDSELESASRADLLVVTGTNLLSAQLGTYKQWPLTPREITAYAGKVVFLGVGWWQYQNDVPTRVGELINRLRHPGLPVGARDGYTSRLLDTIGVPAVNTNCPTMWDLESPLPRLGRSHRVLFTVTDYSPAPRLDRGIVRLLRRRYDEVQVWPQGDGDEAYLRRLRLPRDVRVAGRGLDALSTALQASDYVGTRLHAGIFAAANGRPSLVVAVDNRAIEIGRDTSFPVVPRASGTKHVRQHLERYSVEPGPLNLEKLASDGWLRRLRALMTFAS